MLKIMFVCHGNICRSPMAEFVMKKLITEQGLEKEFVVSSCATSTEEIWGGKGNPVYPPAKRELAKHNIDCTGKTAVQLKWSDYENYDYFVGMDSRNIENMTRMLKGDPDNKIRKLMDYTNRPGDVADPWYTGDFSTTYQDILKGCTEMLKQVKNTTII